jgi:hypothetical protein
VPRSVLPAAARSAATAVALTVLELGSVISESSHCLVVLC